MLVIITSFIVKDGNPSSQLKGMNMAGFIGGGQVRVGNIIKYNNNLWRVMSTEYVKPGKGGAYAQMKLRNIVQGNQTEVRMRTEEKVERVTLDQVEMEYLYEDSAGQCFMNTETYEQVFFSGAILEGVMEYIVPNTKMTVEYYEGKPLGVELPRVVELTVTETDPTMKTATITSSAKPATLETGKVLGVPQFINVGDKIRVDTTEGKYLERVK